MARWSPSRFSDDAFNDTRPGNGPHGRGASGGARLDADPIAHGLFARVATVQADLRVRQARNTLTQADIDQLRALQRQAQLNDVVMDYLAAQQAAMAYLPDVSQEISRLLGVDFGALIGRSSC